MIFNLPFSNRFVIANGVFHIYFYFNLSFGMSSH